MLVGVLGPLRGKGDSTGYSTKLLLVTGSSSSSDTTTVPTHDICKTDGTGANVGIAGIPENDTKYRTDCPGMGTETCPVTYE